MRPCRRCGCPGSPDPGSGCSQRGPCPHGRGGIVDGRLTAATSRSRSMSEAGLASATTRCRSLVDSAPSSAIGWWPAAGRPSSWVRRSLLLPAAAANPRHPCLGGAAAGREEAPFPTETSPPRGGLSMGQAMGIPMERIKIPEIPPSRPGVVLSLAELCGAPVSGSSKPAYTSWRLSCVPSGPTRGGGVTSAHCVCVGPEGDAAVAAGVAAQRARIWPRRLGLPFAGGRDRGRCPRPAMHGAQVAAL